MATNYKKWDKFVSDLSDSENEDSVPKNVTKIEKNLPSGTTKGAKTSEKDPKINATESDKKKAMIATQLQDKNRKYEKRKKVVYKGREIYSWEQNLEEVDIYITPPKGVKARDVICKIEANNLKVGIKGCPLYLDEKLGGTCVKAESYWMMEDGVLHINLQKSQCGSVWMGATQHQGQQLNEMEQHEIKQQVLLERFQREHPGFDFSGAKFNGMAPDARKFMGGINASNLNRNVSFN
mmetsp:Transcript_4039/g.5953  ORF Transcript_4039/g.5953 Transcript_4039/m.5953 type:complete len:237 (-) Transcript_4039:204-914(-)